jgi:hypothetical protein
MKRRVFDGAGISNSAKSVALAAAVTVVAIGYANAADMPVKAPKPVPAVPFFLVNDTAISFTYFSNATDPGVPGSSNTVPGGVALQGNSFARYQGSIDHFDVWQYGTNLIHTEFNQYGPQDPNQGNPGAAGSREFFGFAQATLGWNELTNSKVFSTLLTKDVSFMFRITGGVQNDFFSSQTTQYAPGLMFDLNLPGTVEIGIAAYKEFSHSAFDACGPPGYGVGYDGANTTCVGGGSYSGDRDFEWTWKIFSLISEPIPSTPLTWVNILNVTGPKGTGISAANLTALGPYGGLAGTPYAGLDTVASQLADNETKVEVFEDTRLSLDASKVFWSKPGIWDIYAGYRYWYNKFGTDHNAPVFSLEAPGTSIESTAYVGTTYHFK